MHYNDRIDAGLHLAHKLTKYKNNEDVIVLGLARGGVVVAAEVARELNVPLDVIVACKIGAPSNSELAIGALTSGGSTYLNESLMKKIGVTVDHLKPIMEQVKEEAVRRVELYRAGRSPLNLENKITILVDDGVSTGATMLVAIQAAKSSGAKKIVIAVPVASDEALKLIAGATDEIICLMTSNMVVNVGQFYSKFPQVTDDEIVDLME